MSEGSLLHRKMLDFAYEAIPGLRSENPVLCELARGGSDRVFYRLRSGSHGYVIMHDPRSNHELQQYCDIGAFLFDRGLGAPHIIAADMPNRLLIMEDLGDSSLETVLHGCSTRLEVRSWYRRAAAFLARLHSRAGTDLEMCPALKGRCFGYEAFRFETHYFKESFLEAMCAVTGNSTSALEQEYHMLAAALSGAPRHFMHRDFQSKNIYVKNDQIRIIDFQTATRGPVHYDLASLLKDAYFVLEPDEQRLIAHYYIDTLNDLCENTFSDTEQFFTLLDYASLQRTMQALAAFSFLGLKKGKREFLRYIPAGLDHLKNTLRRRREFPGLLETVLNAAAVLEHAPR